MLACGDCLLKMFCPFSQFLDIVFQSISVQNMILVLYNFVTDDFLPGLSERVVLDKKRTTAENVREVLVNICSRQNGPVDSKKASLI